MSLDPQKVPTFVRITNTSGGALILTKSVLGFEFMVFCEETKTASTIYLNRRDAIKIESFLEQTT